MIHVKICGVRTVSDAEMCAAMGASALGVNFVRASSRYVDADTAKAIARAIRSAQREAETKTLIVGVVADMSLDAMRALVQAAELDCLQLHGNESTETLEALLPHAYKAVHIADATDVKNARRVPGPHLLVDTKTEGALGGSGVTFDWSLVTSLARERRLTLAGGLHPENVERAVREVRPYCVDVASGVERSPGVKDEAKVQAFIRAARRGAP